MKLRNPFHRQATPALAIQDLLPKMDIKPLVKPGLIFLPFHPQHSEEIHRATISRISRRPDTYRRWEAMFDPHNDGAFPTVQVELHNTADGVVFSVVGDDTSMDSDGGMIRSTFERNQRFADEIGRVWFDELGRTQPLQDFEARMMKIVINPSDLDR